MSAGAELFVWIFNLSVFSYLWKKYIRGGRKKPKQAAQPRNDWKTPERVAVENDYQFFNNRYHTLYGMIQTAIAAEEKTQAQLDKVYDLNQYGAVVADKVVKRFENELYTAQQKRLRLENQLHTARRGREKALQTMTRAGV